jgi:hypothetical protein
MARLRRRVANVGSNTVQSSAMLAGVVRGTPMEMPLALVSYYPVATYPWGQTGTLTYEDLQPLWTADGGVIPARDNGGWGWVRPAGRP